MTTKVPQHIITLTYSERETKYGVERMMDLSSPAAPTPKYPNGSNCDAASAASDNAMRNDEMTTITTGNDERSGGVSGVDDVVPLTRTSSLQAIKRQGSGSNYGSMSTIDDATESSADNNSNDERCLEAHDDIDLVVLPAPLLRRTSASCSICLCEYEHGERMVLLPCYHIYHESCLKCWTTNHLRCPLCNSDLMDGFQQRAFPTMALSALGSVRLAECFVTTPSQFLS